MPSLSAEICWAPPERLCRALVALARDGTHPRVQHRAIGLLAALRRPEGAGALAALVEPAPGGGLPWLALDAARSLAAHPGASLSAEQVQRVLAALGGAPRPSMASPVLECARSAEAEAIAAAWLDALAPEARDEVLLSLSCASDRLWASWRSGFDVARPSARHAALRTFDRSGSREAMRPVAELEEGERYRLARTLERVPAGAIPEVLAPFPGWIAQLVADLALERAVLVALVGEQTVLARAREIIERAEAALTELESARGAREARWAAFAALIDEHPYATGTIARVVKGGWGVDIGLPAFLPASRYGPSRLADRRVALGERHVFHVTRANARSSSVVVSLRDLPEDAPALGSLLPIDALMQRQPPPPLTVDGIGLGRVLPEPVTRAIAVLGGSDAGETLREALLARGLHPQLDAPIRLPRLLAADERAQTGWGTEAGRQAAVSLALATLCTDGADRRHLPLLYLGTERPDPADRYAAVDALDALDEPLPGALADDPDPVVRTRALAALARRGEGGAVDLLRASLGSEQPSHVRAVALSGLAAAAPQLAFAPLCEAVESGLASQGAWSAACTAAVCALARSGSDEAWTVLLSAHLRADEGIEEIGYVLEQRLLGREETLSRALTQRVLRGLRRGGERWKRP